MKRFGTPGSSGFGLLALACFFLLPSCGPHDGRTGATSPSTPITVTVSLPVVGLITEPLLPDDMTWTALLPPGGSPHAFEPSPSHGVLLHRSSVLVAVHPHLDGWAMRLTDGSVILLENEEDQHEHGEDNGHIWMDPVHVRAVLPYLGEALCNEVPATCAGMDARIAQFSGTLSALDRELRTLFPVSDSLTAPPPLITALPFIHPLLDRYHVPYIGPIQRVPGDMIAPSALAKLLDNARHRGATKLVSHQSVMSSATDQIAADAGLEVVPLEPTGHGFDTYTDFILYTAGRLQSVATVHAAH